MRKPTKEYSFLCKGRDGYYIFFDDYYQTGGKKALFENLKDDIKECNYIAIVPIGHNASLIVKALNSYDEQDD